MATTTATKTSTKAQGKQREPTDKQHDTFMAAPGPSTGEGGNPPDGDDDDDDEGGNPPDEGNPPGGGPPGGGNPLGPVPAIPLPMPPPIRNNDKEIRLNLPDKFDGNSEKLEKFMLDCMIYMGVNKHIYNNGPRRVAFVTSFLEGNAAHWKQIWYKNEFFNLTSAQQETYDIQDLFRDLEASFSVITHKSDAIHELGIIRQEGTVESHNLKFQGLISKAGIDPTNNNELLVEMYRKSLKQGVASKVLMMDTVPDTLEEWFKKAAIADNNWRRMMSYRDQPKKPQKSQRPQFSYRNFTARPVHDPNAMDVDAMKLSPEKQKLMNEGACFHCKKKGHRIRDCPDRNQGPNPRDPLKGKELHAHIRALLDPLSMEEREEMYALGEDDETDFQ